MKYLLLICVLFTVGCGGYVPAHPYYYIDTCNGGYSVMIKNVEGDIMAVTTCFNNPDRALQVSKDLNNYMADKWPKNPNR